MEQNQPETWLPQAVRQTNSNFEEIYHCSLGLERTWNYLLAQVGAASETVLTDPTTTNGVESVSPAY